jgi:hypothetical protein
VTKVVRTEDSDGGVSNVDLNGLGSEESKNEMGQNTVLKPTEMSESQLLKVESGEIPNITRFSKRKKTQVQKVRIPLEMEMLRWEYIGKIRILIMKNLVREL